MTVSNVLQINGSRPAVTVEATAGAFRLRQVSSYIDLDEGMVDDLIEAVEKLSDPALGKLFTHDAITPAKYVAGGRP